MQPADHVLAQGGRARQPRRGGQVGQRDLVAARQHGVLQQGAQLPRRQGEPPGHGLQGARLLALDGVRGQRGEVAVEVVVTGHGPDPVQRAVREGLAGAGAAQLQQRLADRDLPVGVGGLAAGGRADGLVRRVVQPDRVDVGQAQLGRGQLDDGLDAGGAQPRQHVERCRVGQPVQVDHDAPVQCPEHQAVAVALQQLEQRVRQGPVGLQPGAEPVGDGGGQPLPRREVDRPRGEQVDRHPHGRVVAESSRLQPLQRAVVVVGGPRLQAQRARVLDRFARRPEPGVGRLARGRRRQHGVGPGPLHELAVGRRPGRRRVRSVADAVADRVVQQGHGVHAGARAVEARQVGLDDPANKRGAVGLGGAHRSSSSGTGPALGGPESSRSTSRMTWSVSTGAPSNGVNTVPNCRRDTTAR